MNDDELCFLSAVELRDAIRAREISPVEAVDAVLNRIERVNPSLNAFVTLLPEEARAEAQSAERELMTSSSDELGALHGVPIAMKDLTPTAGVRTTYGSIIHADNVAEHDSLAWARIKAAGAILTGKTTTPDFGHLGVTQSTLTGTTNNPWDPTRTAGGSSGGSAAAVVSGMSHLSWGSDGGGSIRIPASFCGAVGLKASIGRIPGFGEMETYETVATCGPVTRTVSDTALLLDVTAGPDIRDPIALPPPEVRYERVVEQASARGLRIAYSPDLGQALVSHEVLGVLTEALATLRGLGASVTEVQMELPDALDYFVAWWSPEYADALDIQIAAGVPADSIPPLLHELAEQGRRLTRLDMIDTIKTRGKIAAAYANVFAEYDLLITPTMPLSAFPHPGAIAGNTEIDGQPVPMPSINFSRLTEPPSQAGLPAITIPCGFAADGLPVGMQITGPFHGDAAVLQAAAAYEAATPWSQRHPSPEITS